MGIISDLGIEFHVSYFLVTDTTLKNYRLEGLWELQEGAEVEPAAGFASSEASTCRTGKSHIQKVLLTPDNLIWRKVSRL